MKSMQKIIRRRLLGLLVVLLAAVPLALPAHAEKYYTEGGFQYSIVGETVSIHSYFATGAAVEIPEMIAELPVTTIEDNAFLGCSTVRTIQVPSSVTSVGENSFTGAIYLQKLVNKSPNVTPTVPAQAVIVEDFPQYAPSKPTSGEATATPKPTTPAATPSATPKPTTPAATPSATPKPTTPAATPTPTAQSTLPQVTATPAASQSTSIVVDGDTALETAGGSDDAQTDLGGILQQDGSIVTVDAAGNLIRIDAQGKVNMLDDKNTYTLGKTGDGETVILDADGNRYDVEQESTQAAASTPAQEQPAARQSKAPLVAVLVVVVALAGGLVLYKRRK